jgi:UDP-glucose 4-epimerase
MKNILLLGGYGFIGTNILKYIDSTLYSDYSVIVFDMFLSHPHGETFNCVNRSYEGNFSDKTVLKTIFLENKIDFVIHSINTTVPTTSMNARFDIESNLLPTIDLLDLLVEFKIPDIIFLSSGGAVYGEMPDNQPHKESNAEFPKSSYGVVKLAIEKYLLQYKEFYKIRPLILRLSNPYGRHHYSMKQGIINVGLKHAEMNRQFEVWGNGEALKDYIFIDDFCTILFTMISMGVTEGVYNVASNEIMSINQILGSIKEHFPGFSWINIDNKKSDITHFQLDTSKLLDAIGNVWITPFSEGLAKTIEWMHEKNK